MKHILLITFLFCSLIVTSTSEIQIPNPILFGVIEVSNEWTEYTTIDGVKIEYKMTECGGEKMRAQNLLLFKFTNTTNQELTVSWATKEFRNGECWNCAHLDSPEYSNTLTLAPLEVIEGKGNADYNENFYIFGNFIKLVPGMTEQSLTNFELVDLTVR